MKDLSFEELTSRFFVFFIGVFILIMLNANGHVFHVLYVGRVTEFLVVVLLLGGTIYMSMFIGKLTEGLGKFKFPFQLIVSLAILSYIFYLWVV
ncbi:hypothetical protein [Alkalibacillus haloalkaliphilus]|uniref:hypothetical protein n=1 Tax=Alkalibacillus haloalkaliphilus TaxID=94136 RepID=UPI0003794A6B|nr:hypothetical protein [Alkalibacillus haloalkaliphilus]